MSIYVNILDNNIHIFIILCICKDLKPSNILVDVYGEIRLSDFGVTRYLTDQNPSDNAVKPDYGPVHFI
jgi:hypothetical protein